MNTQNLVCLCSCKFQGRIYSEYSLSWLSSIERIMHNHSFTFKTCPVVQGAHVQHPRLDIFLSLSVSPGCFYQVLKLILYLCMMKVIDISYTFVIGHVFIFYISLNICHTDSFRHIITSVACKRQHISVMDGIV